MPAMPLPTTTSDCVAGSALISRPRPCRRRCGRIADDRMLRHLQALTGLQIEVLLVDRRGHDEAFNDTADQAARQHRGLRIGIVVIDGEHAWRVVVYVEYGRPP